MTSWIPPRAFPRELRDLGWYPVLLAAAWFIEVWIGARVAPGAAMRGLALTLGIAGLLTIALSALLGRHRGAFAAALVVVVLCAGSAPTAVLPLLGIFLILLHVERRWSRQGRVRLPWPRLHEGLLVVGVILAVIQLGRLATLSGPPPRLSADAWGDAPLSLSQLPDIYVVLADAHGRRDILNELYGYDDAPFLQALESRGFDVASASRANYLVTRFSLASMLTASYLTELHDGSAMTEADAFAAGSIERNPTFTTLRRAGYEVVVVSGGYEHLGLRAADRFIDTGQPNEFEAVLLANTMVGRLTESLAPNASSQAIRERALAEFALLPRLADGTVGHPRFVLMHVPVPHWPYVFDGTCAPARPAGAPGDPEPSPGTHERLRLIRDQTACVDTMLGSALLELVELDPGAVVIVLSDHGPHGYFDSSNPGVSGLRERAAILFAARTPGHPMLFPDDITLVNVIPILFNAYLGTDLPRQPNQVWFKQAQQDGSYTQVSAGTE